MIREIYNILIVNIFGSFKWVTKIENYFNFPINIGLVQLVYSLICKPNLNPNQTIIHLTFTILRTNNFGSHIHRRIKILASSFIQTPQLSKFSRLATVLTNNFRLSAIERCDRRAAAWNAVQFQTRRARTIIANLCKIQALNNFRKVYAYFCRGQSPTEFQPVLYFSSLAASFGRCNSIETALLRYIRRTLSDSRVVTSKASLLGNRREIKQPKQFPSFLSDSLRRDGVEMKFYDGGATFHRRARGSSSLPHFRIHFRKRYTLQNVRGA